MNHGMPRKPGVLHAPEVSRRAAVALLQLCCGSVAALYAALLACAASVGVCTKFRHVSSRAAVAL